MQKILFIIFVIFLYVLDANASDDGESEKEEKEWDNIMTKLCEPNISDTVLKECMNCVPKDKSKDAKIDAIITKCLKKNKKGTSEKDKFLASWCDDKYNDCVAKEFNEKTNNNKNKKQNTEESDDQNEEEINESDKMRICMKSKLGL